MIRVEPKHMFGEDVRIRPWQNEPEAATARVWALDDGKVWFCVDSHGVSLTLYGLTEDMRKLAALICAAADASDAGLAARATERATEPAPLERCVGGASCPGCRVCE